MGFVVSTKIGNAVVRNRVTRRLREILRDPLRQLPGGSGVVVRALPGVDALSFAQLSEEVLAALGGAARKLEHRGARTGTAR